MLSIMIIGAVFFTYTATTAVGGNGYLAVYICYIVPDGKRPCASATVCSSSASRRNPPADAAYPPPPSGRRNFDKIYRQTGYARTTCDG